jgi:GTPase
MAKPQNIETQPHPKTLIIGIQAPYNQTKNIEAYFEEFKNLLKTNGVETDKEHYIKLKDIHPKTFITPGKLEEIDKICKEHHIEQVYLSEPLTARQAKNLEPYLQCTVFDRTDLILSIFKKAAHTAEGKLQVDIASLEHEKTRLTGKGIHLEQQRGVIGMRSGAGETLKEKDLRYINMQIKQLKHKLEHLQKIRETQRKQRIASGIPQLCLIGYTNAGKSTILNTLTKADVLAQDKLFATLDTTTRELYVDKEKVGILSDTVGFIQYLPHKLVSAFKSTLSELQYADLLLEVVDASDPAWQSHVTVVQEILDELKVEKPIVYIFNKIDRLSDEQRTELAVHARQYQPHIFISACSKETIGELIHYLKEWHKPKI